MAKLKALTTEELKAAQERAFDVGQEMTDLSRRLESNIDVPIEDPVDAARTFSTVARNAADLAAKLLFRLSLQEKHAELEALRRKRDETEAT